MDEEIHVKRSGPSGWDTPENVEKIISALPDMLSGLLTQSQATNKAATEAANVMHSRLVCLAGVVCVGVTAAALMAGYQGRFDTAEKLLIPLISFAGGFGLASRTK
ncbi:hypothetical protein [Duganella qianjiadongensis]|uniref:Uncharacterized protein n=1 Tax=Duganella qianjiadongensis TaxID=2692176 RepID=A0ABW9VKR0_9BURK|nr:hypothetical protein [Duganella qianjiadongensis]MYM39646.1 hypothetical protein [Duganella qianjiadongensis]